MNGLLRMALVAVMAVMFGVVGFTTNAQAALDYKKGTFNKTTATGNQIVTGVGFQPKAVIFYHTGQAAEGFAAHIAAGYGFAAYDGAAYGQAAIAVHAGDNSGATTDGTGYQSMTRCIVMIADALNPTATQAEASIVSFNADGFTINWNKNGGATDIIHYVALGGTDITNAKIGVLAAATIGNNSATGLGFQPDAVLFAINNRSATNDTWVTDNRGNMNIGFMAGGATPSQGSIGFGTRGAQTADADGSVINSTVAVSAMRGNAIDFTASYVSMDADGFTVNVSTANTGRQLYYLALKGGNYKVGVMTQPTTGTPPFNTATTGVGFQPTGLFFASTNSASANGTIDTTAPGASFMIGAGNAGASQGVIWGHNNAFNPNDANESTVTTAILRHAQSTNTISTEADLLSLDADGFTLTYTARTDATARRSIYFAVGSSAVACNVTAAPNVTLGTITASTVDLSWPAVTNAVSYNVYRGGVLVQNVATTSFQDTGRTGNTSYSYTVAGVGAAACEGPLSTADVALTLPGQPTGLTFSAISATTTTVSWTAPIGGAASYDIYRNAVLVQNQAGTSYANSGLSPDVNYSYYIVARNATGTGTASATSSQRTYAATPAAPSLSGATGSSLNVAIGSDTNPGTVAYAIRINGGAFTNQYVQADGTVGAAAAWQTSGVWGTKTVTGLVSSTTYTFDVKARNSDSVETGFGTSANLATTAVNNNTITGAVDASSGDSQIMVSAAYAGDDNANNTLLVEWGTCTGVGACNGTTFPNSSGVIAHQASPYSYTISGLANGTVYQVRVTFVENGGNTVSGTNPTIILDLVPANFLNHNSVVTASTKWAANGGWGITGTKYGRINCDTCHTDTTTNIKRVRTVITTPDGTNWTSTGTPTVNVTLTDTRSGTSTFGDDTGGHATSTKVCEACHSQNKFHNYNTTNNTGGLTHNNNSDCLTCHPHSNGFDAAGCDSCHGYPPPPLASSPVTGSATAGAHAAHVAVLFDCDNCHGAGSKDNGGAAHQTGQIALSFSAYGSTAGTYKGQTSVTAGYTGPGAGTADDSLTCNSVYCHGGTIDGVAPLWNGTVLCGSCHGASTANAPGTVASGSDNSHAKHIALSGVECSTCHGAGFSKDDGTGTTGVAPAGHMSGGVTMAATISGGTYSKTSPVTTQGLSGATAYGTCSGVSCHASGTPQWGTTNTNGCTWCHNNGTANGALLNAVPAATNTIHTTHNNSPNVYVPTDCDACHGAGASTATHTGHANGSLNVAGSLSAYNSTNKNCTNTCHVSTANNLWVAVPPALACLDCHVAGRIAAAAIPSTGLHSMSATGVQKHDDTLATNGCMECHVTEPATHIDGNYTAADSNTNNNAGTSYRWVTRANMTYTEIAPSGGNSGTCSGTGVGGSCHSDNGNWSRRWSTEANVADTVTAVGNTKCNVCHGQWGTWAAGTTHAKASPTTKGSGHDPAPEDCANCHAYLHANYTGKHDSATHRITMNSNGSGYARNGAVYGTSKAGCTACHGGAGDAGHDFDISYFTGETVVGNAVPMPPCNSCHTTGPGPIVVIGTTANSSSSHVDADGPGGATYTINVAGATAQCENCHSGHASGSTGAGDVEIPTTYSGGAVPTMNNQYATHGNKIQLGNTGTGRATTMSATATTEAEMCWSCHDNATVGVSEWGVNNNAKTGGLNYDYGDLYTNSNTVPGTKSSNWTTARWRSGKGRFSSNTQPFWYKRGPIQSTHSVNFDSGTATITTGNTYGFGRTESPDTVANIRCSWCHDVHGTHNGVNGDTSGGSGVADAPYLRGTWKGNPYPEDGAPQLGQANWADQANFNLVPRGSARPDNTGTTAVPNGGGWWIDQNSNNPNNGSSATATAGLCDLCHGTTKDGTWTAAEIGAINWTSAGADANIWVSGYNGHANSVISGAGPGAAGSAENRARNIFTRTLRGTSYRATGNPSHYVDMGLMTHNTSQGRSYRGNSGFSWEPNAGSEGTSYRAFAWGTATQGTTGRTFIWATGTQALTMQTANTEPAHDSQSNYHTFSCSKCHNPHASRLPKLMITNCLDTNHNTWEDNTTFTGTTAPTNVWTGVRHSNWPSAQNCHRLDARAAQTTGQTIAVGRGWNRVTPWLEFTSPNATRTTTTPNIAPTN